MNYLIFPLFECTYNIGAVMLLVCAIRENIMKLITLILMLLTLATQQLDKPYVYATSGPDSYDCSGLVCYCYKETFDITLPRSAKDLGYCEDYLKIESIDELKLGDVVCFNTNEHDKDLSDHVGIYMGDGEFIHASSSKGKVLLARLDEGYFNRVFSWALRIVEDE